MSVFVDILSGVIIVLVNHPVGLIISSSLPPSLSLYKKIDMNEYIYMKIYILIWNVKWFGVYEVARGLHPSALSHTGCVTKIRVSMYVDLLSESY